MAESKAKKEERFRKYANEIRKKYPKGVPKLKKEIIKPPSSGKSWDYLAQSTKGRKPYVSPKDMKSRKTTYGKYKGPKAKTATAVAKKTLGKAIGRALPGVGAALIARDVAKGVSKYINFKDCMKRGGAWDDGKCVGVKKRKVKLTGAANRAVRDPISKR